MSACFDLKRKVWLHGAEGSRLRLELLRSQLGNLIARDGDIPLSQPIMGCFTVDQAVPIFEQRIRDQEKVLNDELAHVSREHRVGRDVYEAQRREMEARVKTKLALDVAQSALGRVAPESLAHRLVSEVLAEYFPAQIYRENPGHEMGS